MPAALMPLGEAGRLRELENFRILDTGPDENFDRIARLVSAALGMPMSAISLIDSTRQWFKSRVGLNIKETPREDAFCAHALEQENLLVVEDASADPRFSDNPLVTAENGIRFYAGAPLKMRSGNTIGMLCVLDSKPHKMSAEHTKLLADMAGIVMNEMELRRLAGIDALTGSFNRRFGEEQLAREFVRATRFAHTFSVGMIDIDHFKQINDIFGHPAGDVVIRAVAQVCEKAVRAQDVFARFGGEEFMLVLPETPLPASMALLDRIRKKISLLAIPEIGEKQITASIGASQLQHTDEDGGDVLKRADQALYRAKQAGRNRVASAEAA